MARKKRTYPDGPVAGERVVTKNIPAQTQPSVRPSVAERTRYEGFAKTNLQPTIPNPMGLGKFADKLLLAKKRIMEAKRKIMR